MNQPYPGIFRQLDSRIQIDRQSAFHQAGHAAAIYLGNKQKRLPAVHFQIVIKPQEDNSQYLDQFAPFQCQYSANFEGGRLIQSLPSSYYELSERFSWPQQQEFRSAFDADVINMLAGSLAEAKYIALRDDEIFNANLVNFAALHFYGGSSDIELITEYMECYMPDKAEREQKLSELFLAAYAFISKRSNWFAISALAEYIREEPKTIISCEEVISLLESRLAA
jgi:hypothetical protein